MPPSMRVMSNVYKRRHADRKLQQTQRKNALELLKQGVSINKTVTETTVSRSTVQRIRSAFLCKDKIKLQRLLDPVNHYAGRRFVVNIPEQLLIVNRAFEAARRGFAMDYKVMKLLLSKVVQDGRPGYRNPLPSDDTLRRFRARNRQLAFRNAENITTARLAAQSFSHVKTLKDALVEIEKQHPGILEDPNRIWNYDETSILPEFGRRVKCFCPADNNRGGIRLAMKENGKHVTAGIAVSAAGHVAPLLMIVAGKRKMSHWLEPLYRKDFSEADGRPHWLTKTSWCPDNTCILMSDSGSVDTNNMRLVIRHINEYIRTVVPKEKSVILLLDGHSSRESIEWLEVCEEFNVIAIKLPANTTHFLQPCDKAVNKAFQIAIRRTRDDLMRQCHISHSNVSLKIKMGVAGIQVITPEIVKQAFKQARMWPMDFSFLQPLGTNSNAANPCNTLRSGCSIDHDTFDLHHLVPYQNRRAKRALMTKLHNITSPQNNPSHVLAEIALLMQNNFVLTRLLCTVVAPVGRATKLSVPNKAIGAGNEAEVLTVGKMKARLATMNASKAAKVKHRQGQKSTKTSKATNKENCPPMNALQTEDAGTADAVDALDDVPIARWMTSKSRVKPAQSALKSLDRNRHAAEALVFLSERNGNGNRC